MRSGKCIKKFVRFNFLLTVTVGLALFVSILCGCKRVTRDYGGVSKPSDSPNYSVPTEPHPNKK